MEDHLRTPPGEIVMGHWASVSIQTRKETGAKAAFGYTLLREPQLFTEDTDASLGRPRTTTMRWNHPLETWSILVIMCVRVCVRVPTYSINGGKTGTLCIGSLKVVTNAVTVEVTVSSIFLHVLNSSH